MTQDQKPQRLTPLRLMNTVDYSYGLALQDFLLQPLEGGAMQLGLVFANCSNGPISFLVDKLDLKFDGCIATEKVADEKPVILAKGLRMQFLCPVLKQITTAKMPRITGKVSVSAVYGHPDFVPERRMFISSTITVVLTQKGVAISSMTDEHREESFTNQVN